MLGTCFPNNKKSYVCRWEDGILVVFLKRKKMPHKHSRSKFSDCRKTNRFGKILIFRKLFKNR